MESNKRSFIRYIVVAFAALVLIVGIMICGGSSEAGYYTLTSNIKRTDGLSLNSRVLLSGEDVGYIENMTLRDDYTVDVEIKVYDWVKIPNDSATAIYSESLLHGKYLAILPGGSEEYMKDGDNFEYSQNSINLVRMISAGAEILKKGNE